MSIPCERKADLFGKHGNVERSAKLTWTVLKLLWRHGSHLLLHRWHQTRSCLRKAWSEGLWLHGAGVKVRWAHWRSGWVRSRCRGNIPIHWGIHLRSGGFQAVVCQIHATHLLCQLIRVGCLRWQGRMPVLGHGWSGGRLPIRVHVVWTVGRRELLRLSLHHRCSWRHHATAIILSKWRGTIPGLLLLLLLEVLIIGIHLPT